MGDICRDCGTPLKKIVTPRIDPFEPFQPQDEFEIISAKDRCLFCDWLQTMKNPKEEKSCEPTR
jgi:hypothetical protein